ncbi:MULTISPECIES: SRPBCC family protein [unclassified Luteococcus]|uniref:SRPBCC family protein n=1 Tax=unclassified Luteococcus TaxID=2639923 RepID=UPI00313E3570
MSEQIAGEAPGSSQDTAVRVSRQVSTPIKDVWKVLLTDEGTEALLGPGGKLGDKGHTWQADDGTHGVTRSFHPLEQIRFSWHRDQDAPATIVDLELRAVDDQSTELEIVHDKLPDDADREWLTEHWTKALDRIADDAL